MYCSKCGTKLNQNISLCPSCGHDNSQNSLVATKVTNITSLQTFIFFSFLSFGIYPLVWMFRTWKFIKEKENIKISPFFRSLFSIFFVYSLLKRIKKYSEEAEYGDKFSPGLRAFGYIFIQIAFSGGENTPARLIPFIAFTFLLKPLDAMNFYFQKNEENTLPREMKWWHYILVIFCLLIWYGVIEQFFVNYNFI